MNKKMTANLCCTGREDLNRETERITLPSLPVPSRSPLIVGEGERGAHAMEYRVYGLVASAFTIGCTIFFN